MQFNGSLSERQLILIRYIFDHANTGDNTLPSLKEISKHLNSSVASLREDLETLRFMGIVEAQPRKGLRLLPLSLVPVITKSAQIATYIDEKYFHHFSALRLYIEKSCFFEAAEKLELADIKLLETQVNIAINKLEGHPIQIPFDEHKQLHLMMYTRLDNIFIEGILTSYWNIYKAVGLDLYTDIGYLRRVWQYHQNIVEKIKRGNIIEAHQLLIEHMDLLYLRSG